MFKAKEPLSPFFPCLRLVQAHQEYPKIYDRTKKYLFRKKPIVTSTLFLCN